MIRAWRNLLLALALPAAFMAPATTAQQAVGLSLLGKERGVDDGDQADPKAERQRLKIAELSLDAKIAGPLADIELELLIASNSQDADSADEARLTMTLPRDAVITGYALDVGGQMIPGQLLEQAKARNIYEDKVREGIDPGLAEVSAQNVFSTRIYPVTAQQPRRVRIRYSAPFDPVRGLALPLDTDLPVGKAQITVAVQGFAGAPTLKLAGQSVALQDQGGAWRGSSALANAQLDEGLTLRGKLAGTMTIARHANGRSFFVIADSAQIPLATKAATGGGRMRIYWDRSLSHRGPQIADEIDALVAAAESARPDVIDLVTFASDTPQLVSVSGAAALRAALGQVTYRGATSLARLDALRLPDARRCVLVSDGQLTLDRAEPFRPDCRLSTLSADPGADAARLARLAQRQHGQFVRIGAGKGREAAAALTESGYAVTSLRIDDGAKIAWRALAAPAGGWVVVGELPFDPRLPSPGPIRLRVASPGGAAIEHLYEPDGNAYPLNAAGALWASDRVAELGDDPAVHDQMVKLAKAFQVAGPNMSFLVLERPTQYLDADIAPPAGFPKDWLEEYRSAQTGRADEARDAKAERLSFVLKEWKGRKEWWSTSYAPRSRPRQADKPSNAPRDLHAPPPPAMVAPPAAPAPAPVQQQEEAASASSDGAADSADVQIVVTGTARSNPSGMSAVPVSAVQEGAEIEVKLDDLLADREYLTALSAAPEDQRLAVLAAQEAKFGTVPTFYLDTAEWFRLKGDAATARQLLLSALDLPGSDDETLQIVAFRLERDGDFDAAVQLAERLAAGATFRPQPQRALALALATRGQSRGPAGLPDLERAFVLLTKVALEPALEGNEYDGLEVIALMEANDLIPKIDALDGEWQLDRRLVSLLDTDARIVIEWTADDADIDLWVTEPNGEEVMYSSKLSSAGGQISNDMTDGYGPEEYAIHRAPKGEYQVRVNGFDADRINPNGAGHVLVRLVRNFGRPNERSVLVDVDLTYQKGGNRNDDGEMKPVALLRVN